MKQHVLFVLLFISLSHLFAQETDYLSSRTWFLLVNQLQINEKWSVTNEVHERTSKMFHEQGQFLVRPSINYHLDEKTEFSVSYTYVHLWPSKTATEQLENNVHNIWEQANFKFNVGKIEFQNRFRLEHRWLGDFITNNNQTTRDGYRFSNRFRFRFTGTRTVYRFNQFATSIFINAFDELWVNQNSQLLPTNFTRNWLYIGAGIAFNIYTKLQFGYLSQYDFVSDNTYSRTTIGQLTFIKNFKR